MVVHDVCKVVGWKSVALQKYAVLNVCRVNGDFAKHHIGVGAGHVLRHFLTDNVRLACGEASCDFLFGEVSAMLIVGMHAVLVREAFKALFRAEAIVCSAEFNEFFGVFFVYIHTLGLNVRSIACVLVRSFVIGDAGGFKRAINHINCALNLALLVGILYAENKLSAVLARKKKCIESRAQIADMHKACWRWSESCSNFSHI